MKIKMTRENQVVRNKADGYKYIVSEKLEDGNFRLLQLDEEGNPTETAKMLTEQNAIAFMFLSDPNPVEVPEGYYSVEDGMLICDGKPVTYSMGQIEPVDVIGKIEGSVLFLAKGTDQEYAVYGYNPYLDKATEEGFTKFCEVPEHPVLLQTEFCNILSYVHSEMGTIKDEDGKEKEAEFLKGSNNMIVDRKGIQDTFEFPFIPDPADVQVSGQSTFIGGEMIQTEGDDAEIIDRTHAYLRIFRGAFDKLTPFEEKAVVTDSRKFGTVYIGDSLLKLQYENEVIRTPMIRMLKEYPYLVNIDDQEELQILAFSDNAENQKIKVLECRKTPDRGTVYTVR